MAAILPKRRKQIIVPKKDYLYGDILSKNISLDKINAVIFSSEDLALNMDKMRELVNNGLEVKCFDFESVQFLDKLLTEKVDNRVVLVDDSLRINRDYIDLTKIHNIDVVIPFTYLMWGVKFNDSVKTYCFQFYNGQSNYINYNSKNGNEELSLEDLKKIRNKLIELSKYNCHSDVDKVLLISDYIQSRTQFIDAYETQSTRGVFVVPSIPKYDIYCKKSGLVETVHNNHNGVCMGISNYSTMLLNNDILDVECESLTGSGHVWNKVLIDGKYYFFDNTWSITRSDKFHEDGLITLEFSNNYLLFGANTGEEIGHHHIESIPVYCDKVLAENDYPNVSYESQFEYLKEPIYKSYLKK